MTQLVEHRLGGLDYAIVRLAGDPQHDFGTVGIAGADPPLNDMLCIIGQPAGQRKRIEAGPLTGLSGTQIQYNDIDTLGGNSGSGILHSPSGNVVGVHTNGGCTATGGFTFGVRISNLLQASSTLRSLRLSSPRLPARAPIVPVSRSADHLDIVVTDVNGVIRTAAWEPAFTDWWHGWWELNGGRAAPGAPVTAVSRSTDKLDAFVVGPDGRVYTAAREPVFTDWWHGWWSIGD